jgi:hypothetical protein
VESIFWLCIGSFVALVAFVALKHPWRTNWDLVEDPPEQDTEAEDRANEILDEIYAEWESARSKFGPFNSSHEGFAVLHEEFDELKAEVWANPKKRKNRDAKMRAEAIQVGAMALRFLTDCCEP